MSAVKYGRMVVTNFGPFVGSHDFDWDRGPEFWFLAGQNKKNPELGANGAGKTMLITALYWCQTGRTLRNKRPGERVRPREGSGTTSVELQVTIGNAEHVIVRTHNPNKLTLDGEVVSDDKVLALLPDPEVMLYTYIFGQFNEHFLDLKPEAQSQLFNDLLDLDKWIEASKNAGDAVSAATTVVQRLEREISSLDGSIAEIAESEAQCAILEREYDENIERQQGEIKADLATLAKEAQDLEARLLKIPGKPANLAGLVKAHADAQQWFREWSSLKASHGANVTSYTRQITKLTEELDAATVDAVCPACGQKLDTAATLVRHHNFELGRLRTSRAVYVEKEAEAVEQIEEWRQEVEATNTRLQTAREAELKRQQSESTLQTRLAAVRSEASALYRAQERLEQANPHTGQLAKLVARRMSQEGDRATKLEKLATETTALDLAKLWQEGFRSIRLSIIEETLSEVALAGNRYAERLGLRGWEIVFATERETLRGTTKLGFTTFLYQPGEEKPVPWDTYCGGESQRWQLATTFGLSEVLLERAGMAPNIEIYDEPSKGLSDEGMADLLECLAERARETGRTVWLVDHHALTQGAFDGTVTVLKDPLDGSRIIQ